MRPAVSEVVKRRKRVGGRDGKGGPYALRLITILMAISCRVQVWQVCQSTAVLFCFLSLRPSARLTLDYLIVHILLLRWLLMCDDIKGNEEGTAGHTYIRLARWTLVLIFLFIFRLFEFNFFDHFSITARPESQIGRIQEQDHRSPRLHEGLHSGG